MATLSKAPGLVAAVAARRITNLISDDRFRSFSDRKGKDGGHTVLRHTPRLPISPAKRQRMLEAESKQLRELESGSARTSNSSSGKERKLPHQLTSSALLGNDTSATKSESFQIAAIFVQHAIDKDPIHGVDWLSERSRRFYKLGRSKRCIWSMRVAVFVLVTVATMEPAVTWGAPLPHPEWKTAIVMELCSLTVLAIGTWVHATYRRDPIVSVQNTWLTYQVPPPPPPRPTLIS